MNAMEKALYEAGAHIAFKEVKPDPPTPLKKWKTPRLPGFVPVGKSAQRIVGGIPRDPVDKTAALVTSKKPK